MHISHMNITIADLCYYMNLPDSLVELKWFKKLISIACLVSSDYKPPGKKKIGGKIFFYFSLFPCIDIVSNV